MHQWLKVFPSKESLLYMVGGMKTFLPCGSNLIILSLVATVNLHSTHVNNEVDVPQNLQQYFSTNVFYDSHCFFQNQTFHLTSANVCINCTFHYNMFKS